MDNRLACLPPVINAATTILILGSLPGSASLTAKQYYAHPQNQFWRIIGTILKEDDFAARPYQARLQTLQTYTIGLWDVVGRAHRKGSLDQALKNITTNPLIDCVRQLPELKLIAFNGKTATRLGLAALAGLTPCPATVSLPSTSPAHTMAYEKKLALWRAGIMV